MSLKQWYRIIMESHGVERGETLFAFLTAHTLTKNEPPTLENSKALAEATQDFQSSFLRDHFNKVDEIVKVIISLCSSENTELLYPYLRQYHKFSQKDFWVWTCLPHINAPYAHPEKFGNDNFTLSILEPFNNKQPLLLNKQTIQQKTDVAYLPQIVLDSNILQYVNWYVNDPGKLENINYIQDMLKYFVRHDYLYSPYFYYFEAISKGSSKQHLKLPFTLLTRMRCLNRQPMLENGLFSFDDEKYNALLKTYNAADFDDLVDATIGESEKIASYFEKQKVLVTLFYSTLIKLVLIQSSTKTTINEKIEQLIFFLSDTIRTQLSFEFFLGICYFCGGFKRFLNIERNMKFEKARKLLTASAWDLLLLRQPELFLAGGNHDFTAISSVCTNDISLYRLSQLYELKCLLKFTEHDLTLPVHQANDGQLLQLIGETNLGTIRSKFNLEVLMALFQKNKDSTLSHSELQALVNNLEKDLSLVTS